MSQLTRTIRSWFPAVMIVVCSAVYIIFFDARDPQTADQTSELVPPIESGQGLPEKASNLVPATDILPAETSERTPLQSGVARISAVEEEDDSQAGVAGLETADSLGNSSLGQAVDNLVINSQYPTTPVQDYRVGLERAGTGEMVVNTSSTTENLSKGTGQPPQGVVYNPFFSPGPDSSNPSTNPGATRQVFEPRPELGSVEFAPIASFETPPLPLNRNEPTSKGTSDAERLPSTRSITPTNPQSILEAHSDSLALAHSEPLRTSYPESRPANFADSGRTIPFPVNEHVRQRVLEHWEYGSSLARRDAIHLAQREFFSGMSLLADHFDQLQGSTHYLVALREGFSALHEAGDFHSTSQSRPADVLVIAQRHETPLLREQHFETSSHSQARTAYLLYAKERLKFVFENQIAADELFYVLGKLHLATFEQSRKTDNIEFQRATTLFECALLANPRHAKSNNELAVIRAKNGQWASAKQLLQQTVAQHADFTEAWENLVKVHQRLGELELAGLAGQQVERLRGESNVNPSVKLVNMAEFAQTEAAMEGNDNFAVPAVGDQRPQSVLDGRAGAATPQASPPSRFGQSHTNPR